MKTCGWPAGCEMWTFEPADVCAYHGKIRAGLIQDARKVVEKEHPGPTTQTALGGPERAPLGNEAFETADMARRLGVSARAGWPLSRTGARR